MWVYNKNNVRPRLLQKKSLKMLFHHFDRLKENRNNIWGFQMQHFQKFSVFSKLKDLKKFSKKHFQFHEKVTHCCGNRNYLSIIVSEILFKVGHPVLEI